MGWLSIASTVFSIINRLTRWAERRGYVQQGRAEATQAYTIAYLESKGASREQIARAALEPIEEINKRLDDTDFVD